MSSHESGAPFIPFNSSEVVFRGRLEVAARRLMSYEALDRSLTLAQAFNKDQSAKKGHYLARQFEDFAEAASWAPGFQGVFATGYPFYANREDGTVVAVNEIDRFIGEVKDKALAKTGEMGSWICGMCQMAVEHKDLKEKCRPCAATEVKPRDVFKALPDLDFWVVVEGTSPHVEGALESLVHRVGFQQSDPDIYFAIKDTNEVIEALQEGREPKARLPIDLHVVTVEQLTLALQELQAAIVSKPMGKVTIAPRSLHMIWEDIDEPYDFLKDFVFSFTESQVMNSQLNALIQETRRIVAQNLTPQSAVDLIKQAHPKEERQLTSTPELEDLLRKRVEGWY